MITNTIFSGIDFYSSLRDMIEEIVESEKKSWRDIPPHALTILPISEQKTSNSESPLKEKDNCVDNIKRKQNKCNHKVWLKYINPRIGSYYMSNIWRLFWGIANQYEYKAQT